MLTNAAAGQDSMTVTMNGWSCYRCGAWVMNGVTHSCWTSTSYPTTVIQRGALTDEEIERIAKRVAELLAERLSG